MKREMTRAALVLGLLAVAGSASAGAKLRSKWTAPEAQKLNFAGKSVVAMVIHNDDVVRKSTEIMLAKSLIERGVQGVPSYELLPTIDPKDTAAAKAVVAKAGMAGVVAMRVVNTDTDIVTGPSQVYGVPYADPSYGSFWGGYYTFGWGVAAKPGPVSLEKIFDIEMLVFDLKQDKLIWAGTARVKDPDSVKQILEDVMKAAISELRKAKLVR